MKRYEIAYRRAPLRLDVHDEAFWAGVPAGAIDIFPWYQQGDRQGATFRAVWSDDGLYLRFDCQDRHISAEVTIVNGPVSRDSAVEFFVAPNPKKPLNYYNFEMNCIGTRLMGTHCDWGEGYMDRSLDLGLDVSTTVPGPLKAESPQDDGWRLVARIPWAHFAKDAPHLPPRPGDVWRANFYRLGGRTDPQAACWSPIDLPHPSFHAPEFFGEVVFIK